MFQFVCAFRDWKSELSRLQETIQPSSISQNMINVERGHVLQCFIRAFSRKKFDPFKRIDVCFVDINDTSEGAIDNGGPSREFFRLLLQSVIDSELFEGPTNVKHLTLCAKGLWLSLCIQFELQLKIVIYS